MPKVIRNVFLYVIILSTVLLFGCGSNSALSLHKKGIKEMSKMDYEGAKKSFNLAINQRPERAEYYISYANALILAGENQEAIQVLDEIYMDKDLSIILENNKKINFLKGNALSNLGLYEEALVEYDTALSSNKLIELNNDIYISKAGLFSDQGLYNEAIEILNKVIEVESRNARALAYMGHCYNQIGDLDKAVKNYELAISIDKNNIDYYVGLYNAYMQHNKIDEAAKVFANYNLEELESNPLEKAKVYYYINDFDNALIILKQLEVEGNVEANFYLGKIYQQNKDIESAIICFEKYVEASEIINSEAFLELGNLYMKKGDYKSAKTIFERGIQQKDIKLMKKFKRNVIITNEKIGEFEEAYDKIKEYIKEYPEDEEAIREKEFLDIILHK